MKTKTSRKTKTNLPAKAKPSLKLLDLKPKQNPKAGGGPHVKSIQDGLSNTMMLGEDYGRG
jgi:hypothetical protein